MKPFCGIEEYPVSVNRIVNDAIAAAKKLCHVSSWDQWDEASSIEKRTPPIGAPNAAATPVAAPIEMKLT